MITVGGRSHVDSECFSLFRLDGACRPSRQRRRGLPARLTALLQDALMAVRAAQAERFLQGGNVLRRHMRK
eukprot:848268-Prorocentrum_lima.AAC.1